MNNVIDFINTNRDRYVEELKAYLAIPSISALPEHAADVKRAAEWSADEMRRIGMQNVRLVETPGFPVVYGDWLGAEGAPTILFYGHYDVQPVDPVNLWESPPFEATIRDGEHNGTTVRAKRGGAIPGAVHVEWSRNLGPDGAFKPAGELRAMYEAAGVTPDKEIVTYCQGGYRAAHGYLALRLLGYPRVRNYTGSWKEWGDREDLPIEKPE